MLPRALVLTIKATLDYHREHVLKLFGEFYKCSYALVGRLAHVGLEKLDYLSLPLGFRGFRLGKGSAV